MNVLDVYAWSVASIFGEAPRSFRIFTEALKARADRLIVV